ncbi:MAG: fructose-bisphosphate aldolase [Lachnospiraceae bacterium]|nr:fructose-bisphosphate aldolase [Lachnospiraceae bacterium]
MMIGKEVRMNRLIPGEDGKYFGLTVDHAIARGMVKGLDIIDDTIAKMAAGNPNAITMHKGIAEKCFARFAGKIPLVLKLTTFGVYHYEEDIQVADVEEAVCMGADAVSVGCIVGGDNQNSQLVQLGRITKEAHKYGMPVISHIYPRGNHITRPDQYSVESVTYAARAAAELGVDLVKTNYTGTAESFARVVQAVPTRVAIAGGMKCSNVDEFLQQTRDVMDSGAVGVTYGRFVMHYPDVTALVLTLNKMIHDGLSLKESRELLEHLENKHKEAGEHVS